MNTSIGGQSDKFEQALQRYVDAYMTERDPDIIKELLADQFCGFGTGEDEYFTDLAGGMAIFNRDIASAPNPLICTLHQKSLQQINDHHAIATLIFDLKTEITAQEIKLNKLRLMMAFIEIEGTIKISGMHISFPSIVHDHDESYPLKELEDRMQVLKKMVEAETKTFKEAYAELSHMINFDKLTGLYSRNYMDDYMESTFQQFQRFGRVYTLMMIDLDDFKHVNDTHGHHVGDEVLQITATTIMDTIRNTDKACRWGGDEMIVILPETSIEEAKDVATRIMTAIEKAPWPTNEGVTASIGISSVRPADVRNDALQRVDQAMYQAKKSGKNQVILLS